MEGLASGAEGDELLDATRAGLGNDGTFAALGPLAGSAAPVLESLLRATPLPGRATPRAAIWRRAMLLIALVMISRDNSPWSEQLASELAIEEVTTELRRSQELVLEAVTSAEELAWLRALVRVLRHWDVRRVRSAEVLETAQNLRIALLPDLPWTHHPLLATLPAALDELEVLRAKPAPPNPEGVTT